MEPAYSQQTHLEKKTCRELNPQLLEAAEELTPASCYVKFSALESCLL